jgi:hypothetical protein
MITEELKKIAQVTTIVTEGKKTAKSQKLALLKMAYLFKNHKSYVGTVVHVYNPIKLGA